MYHLGLFILGKDVIQGLYILEKDVIPKTICSRGCPPRIMYNLGKDEPPRIVYILGKDVSPRIIYSRKGCTSKDYIF